MLSVTSRPLGYHERPTGQQTDRRTDGLIGKLHLKLVCLYVLSYTLSVYFTSKMCNGILNLCVGGYGSAASGWIFGQP